MATAEFSEDMTSDLSPDWNERRERVNIMGEAFQTEGPASTKSWVRNVLGTFEEQEGSQQHHVGYREKEEKR